jgi:hypothetical protein
MWQLRLGLRPQLRHLFLTLLAVTAWLINPGQSGDRCRDSPVLMSGEGDFTSDRLTASTI